MICSPHAYFKKMSKMIESIASMYFASKKKIEQMSVNSFSSGNIEILNPFSLIVEKVEKAFSCLDEIEKIFINNDFFFEKYPYWWESIYSRCTYYRYKRKAMGHFLEAYEKS
ncbi:MAG: hypothetical protein WC201_04415 [Bacilli bacterium]